MHTGLKFVVPAALCVALAACATKPRAGAELGQAEPAPQLAEGQAAPAAPPAATAVRPSLQEQFAAAAGERVFFALDSSALDADGRDTLVRQAEWLRRNPDVRVLVAGHADERGTREYNMALGARRAQAARQALIGQGVAAGRIETVSYGKERPLDPGSTEEAWSRNRNAHTQVLGSGAVRF